MPALVNSKTSSTSLNLIETGVDDLLSIADSFRRPDDLRRIA
jgi:hypothetical protein